MKRAAAVLMAAILLWTCQAMGEGTKLTETEWYRQALKDSEMRLGNNARLKKVIERARSGEEITVAVIGGSITEGAGAGNYQECWASRFWNRFKAEYGAEGTSNVSLVNAGVSGTPSTFGYMRYGRDVLARVPEKDADGLPDLVIVEFAVNDWMEPTGYRCYESMVKDILDAPNGAAVILLFTVSRQGYGSQDDLRKIGDRYDLMMVSVKDGIFSHLGKELAAEDFFFDDYHPSSLGHRIMMDFLMQAIADAAGKETDPEADADVKPVYGTDFVGLKTLFGDTEQAGFTVERGGFCSVDKTTYRNGTVGWVCGENFAHGASDPMEPLKISGTFRKCLVAWKADKDPAYGAAEVLVDGEVKKTLKGAPDKWGQSEAVLVLDDDSPAEHTVEVRVKDEGKKFTVTAVGLVE